MAVVTLFFGNRSYALLFLPVLIGGFYFCNFYTQYQTFPSEMNLGFWGIVSTPFGWIIDMVAPLLILLNSIMVNTLFNRNEFMEKNNFLTSLIYVICMSFFPSFYHVDGLALANTLLILTLIQFFRLYQNEDGRRAVFNASILYGMACTLFPLLLIGFPFLFWLIWVMRPFVLRESLLLLTGFITPLIYTLVYTTLFHLRLDRSHFSSSPTGFQLLDAAVIGSGLFVLGIFSVNNVLMKLRGSSIRLKKLFRMLGLLIWLFLGILTLEFFAYDKLSAGCLLLAPLVFFLVYAFGERQLKSVPTFTFYLLLLFAVGKFFIPFDEIAF